MAIYGAGSLGIILGAYLSKAGIPVDLVNRNKVQVDALNKEGARIRGTVSFDTPVTALLPEQMTGTYDLVFLLTKQLENEQVARFLAPLLGENGILCTMQNGLPEPSLTEILGPKRVVGCTIGWGATLAGPGNSVLTSAPDKLSFSLGSLDRDADDPLFASIKEVLEHMGPVSVEQNFIGTRWVKLLVNAAFSGMGTVAGCTFGQVSKNRKSRRYVQRTIKECIDVANGSGIRIEPIQGFDVARLFDYHSPCKRLFSFAVIPVAMKKYRDIRPSMLQDLEAGKKRCEVDAINGVVAAFGRKAGVPTPYNDLIIETIHRFEKGTASPGFQNLSRFGEAER
jgi:2-dehydropantoate 2-reductase